MPGSLTPSLVESTVRLGTCMTFPEAAGMLAHFTKVDISEATARRATEGAGGAYVRVQMAQVEVLEKETPEAPAGPSVQQVSVDGAFVPLIGKEWAEVKTLAIGEVHKPVLEKGEWVVHTKDLSYFSRLADHETFARLATVETHRRGVEKAGLVCAVGDGAEWVQGFVDLHRPNAVRILDWAHAAEYMVKAAQAVFGAETAATCQWLSMQLHELKHGDPQKVLGKLRGLRDDLAIQGRRQDALKVVSGSLEYLEKRKDQIRYAEFLAAGYPIGSGMVESANKLVVEVRLKGAGMHWARMNVDPMVALRTIHCNGRWKEAWPQISDELRRQAKERSALRRSQRQPVKAMALEARPPELVEVRPKSDLQRKPDAPKARKAIAKPQDEPFTGPRKPAANHPWRHMTIGRARWTKVSPNTSAKS